MIAPLDLNIKELEVYKLLYKKMDFDTFEVKYTLDQLSDDSDKILGLTKRKVEVIVKKFIENNYISIIQKGVKGRPTIYKITKIKGLMCDEYVTNKGLNCDELGTNEGQINVENTNVEVIEGTNMGRIRDECVTNKGQICDEYVTPINDKDKDKDIYSLIIENLNAEAGTKYKASSKKTKSVIDARLKDKFTLEDFYNVISIKVKEWKGTTMEKYLRPETLFGNKFEGYLNQKFKTLEVKQNNKKEVRYESNSNVVINDIESLKKMMSEFK